ncbi:hypothetical protein K7X08_028520 [Anisodus acutangulus]|uniref:Uncharacterized protein n=1 Tax=Anisodus acutangulus TaxID=402998 RepID=A0A9Q1M5I6_9SOLA|nr:hypothetical protein K7X08_028520 [Anisodus acutangulus]
MDVIFIGSVTNRTTGAIEGPSVVNPEKLPLGAVVGKGTSGAWRGVDTRTSPSLSLQPSIVGGLTGMYTHSVAKVQTPEELMTKQLVGSTQVGPTVNTASLPFTITNHMGVHGCTTSSSGANNGFESTVGAS